jgi:hypothetical protein
MLCRDGTPQNRSDRSNIEKTIYMLRHSSLASRLSSPPAKPYSSRPSFGPKDGRITLMGFCKMPMLHSCLLAVTGVMLALAAVVGGAPQVAPETQPARQMAQYCNLKPQSDAPGAPSVYYLDTHSGY